MNNLSGSYAVPATSSDLAKQSKQSSMTPDNIKRCIASARRSALIEQLISRENTDGGADDA